MNKSKFSNGFETVLASTFVPGRTVVTLKTGVLPTKPFVYKSASWK